MLVEIVQMFLPKDTAMLVEWAADSVIVAVWFFVAKPREEQRNGMALAMVVTFAILVFYKVGLGGYLVVDNPGIIATACAFAALGFQTGYSDGKEAGRHET